MFFQIRFKFRDSIKARKGDKLFLPFNYYVEKLTGLSDKAQEIHSAVKKSTEMVRVDW